MDNDSFAFIWTIMWQFIDENKMRAGDICYIQCVRECFNTRAAIFSREKVQEYVFAAVFLRLYRDESLTFPEKFLKVSECVRLGVCACSCVYTEWPRFTTFPFIYKFFDQFGIDFFRGSSDFLVIRNLK